MPQAAEAAIPVLGTPAGEGVEQKLAAAFVGVVEAAAAAGARTMGQGNARTADHAAVEAMRAAFEAIIISGRIVIGEGERDKSPMLYVGERVGTRSQDGTETPEIDIAVDPLEGTNLCATGGPGALAVVAASERNGLLHAPDCYMEKLIAGPACRGVLDLDAPVAENLRRMAKCLERDVEDLVIVVLDRARHRGLVDQIRRAGARIRLISDGDLSAGIAAAVRGAGVHGVVGIGGAPEGVLTAAALRCLGGEMLARLVIDTPELQDRIEGMGISDPHRIYTAEELAPGAEMIFAACGVTAGALLNGVRFFAGGHRTHSIVMTLASKQVRFIDTVHLNRDAGPRGVRLY